MAVSIRKRAFLEFAGAHLVAVFIAVAVVSVVAPGSLGMADVIHVVGWYLVMPVDSLSWFPPAKYVVPVLVVVALGGFVLKITWLRVIAFHAVALVWLWLGMVSLAAAY